ncbi:hypothetical protein HDU98_002132 [Podochytrium sp. JEL0797]|nr:hypothetical protein HDU98_002132 [Podochytrium sp. JEL0797]
MTGRKRAATANPRDSKKKKSPSASTAATATPALSSATKIKSAGSPSDVPVINHSLPSAPMNKRIFINNSEYFNEGTLPEVAKSARPYFADMQNPVTFLAKLVPLYSDLVPLQFDEASARLFERLEYEAPNRRQQLFMEQIMTATSANKNLSFAIVPFMAKCAKRHIPGWKVGDCVSAEVMLSLLAGMFGVIENSARLVMKASDGVQRIVDELMQVKEPTLVTFVSGGWEANWYCPSLVTNCPCSTESDVHDWATSEHDACKKMLWKINLLLLSKLGPNVTIPSALLLGSDACHAAGVDSFCAEQRKSAEGKLEEREEGSLNTVPFLHPACVQRLQSDFVPTLRHGKVIPPKQAANSEHVRAINWFMTTALKRMLEAATGSKPNMEKLNLAYLRAQEYERFAPYLLTEVSFTAAAKNSIKLETATTMFGKPLEFSDQPLLPQIQALQKTESFKTALEALSFVKTHYDASRSANPPPPKVKHPVIVQNLMAVYVDSVEVRKEDVAEAAHTYSCLLSRRDIRNLGLEMAKSRLDDRVKSSQQGVMDEVFQGFLQCASLNEVWDRTTCMVKKPSTRYRFPASPDELPASIGNIVDGSSFVKRDNDDKLVGIIPLFRSNAGDTTFSKAQNMPSLAVKFQISMHALFGGSIILVRECKQNRMHVFTMAPEVYRQFCLEMNGLKTRAELADPSMTKRDRKEYGATRFAEGTTYPLHLYLGYATANSNFNAIAIQFAKKVDLPRPNQIHRLVLSAFESKVGYHRHQKDDRGYARRDAPSVISKATVAKMDVLAMFECAKLVFRQLPAYPVESVKEMQFPLDIDVSLGIDGSVQPFPVLGGHGITVSFVPTQRHLKLGLQTVTVSLSAKWDLEIRGEIGFHRWFPKGTVTPPKEFTAEVRNKFEHSNMYLYLMGEDMDPGAVEEAVDGAVEGAGVGIGVAGAVEQEMDIAVNEQSKLGGDVGGGVGDGIGSVVGGGVVEQELDIAVDEDAVMDEEVGNEGDVMDQELSVFVGDPDDAMEFDASSDDGHEIGDPMEFVGADLEGGVAADEVLERVLSDAELKTKLEGGLHVMHELGDKIERPKCFNNFNAAAKIEIKEDGKPSVEEAQQEKLFDNILAQNNESVQLLYALAPVILILQMLIESAVYKSGIMSNDAGPHPVIQFLESDSLRIHRDFDGVDKETLQLRLGKGDFDYGTILCDLAKRSPLHHLEDLLHKLQKLDVKGPQSWKDVLMLTLVWRVEGYVEVVDDADGIVEVLKGRDAVGWWNDGKFECVSVLQRTADLLEELQKDLVVAFVAKVALPTGLQLDPRRESIAGMLTKVKERLKKDRKKEDDEVAEGADSKKFSMSALDERTKVRIVPDSKVNMDTATTDLKKLVDYRSLTAQQRKGCPFPVDVKKELSIKVYHTFEPTVVEVPRSRGSQEVKKLVPKSEPAILKIPVSPDLFVCSEFLLNHKGERSTSVKAGEEYAVPIFTGDPVNITASVQSNLFWLLLSNITRSFSLTSRVSLEKEIQSLETADADAAQGIDLSRSLQSIRRREISIATMTLSPISLYYNTRLRKLQSSNFRSISAIRINEVNDVIYTLSQLVHSTNYPQFWKTFAPSIGGTILNHACESVETSLKSWVTNNRTKRHEDFRGGMVYAFRNFVSVEGVIWPAGGERHFQTLKVHVRPSENQGVWMKFAGYNDWVRPDYGKRDTAKNFPHGLRGFALQRGDETPRLCTYVTGIRIGTNQQFVSLMLPHSRPIPFPTDNPTLTYDVGAFQFGYLPKAASATVNKGPKYTVSAPLMTETLSTKQMTQLSTIPVKLYLDVHHRNVFESDKANSELLARSIDAIVKVACMDVSAIGDPVKRAAAETERKEARELIELTHQTIRDPLYSGKKRRKITFYHFLSILRHKGNLELFHFDPAIHAEPLRRFQGEHIFFHQDLMKHPTRASTLLPDRKVLVVDKGSRTTEQGQTMQGVSSAAGYGAQSKYKYYSEKGAAIQTAMEDSVKGDAGLVQRKAGVETEKQEYGQLLLELKDVRKRMLECEKEKEKRDKAQKVDAVKDNALVVSQHALAEVLQRVEVKEARIDAKEEEMHAYHELRRREAKDENGFNFRDALHKNQQRANHFSDRIVQQTAIYNSKHELYVTSEFRSEKLNRKKSRRPRFKGYVYHSLTMSKHTQITNMTANLMDKRLSNTGALCHVLRSTECGSTILCTLCGSKCDVGADEVFGCTNVACQMKFHRDGKAADFSGLLTFSIAFGLDHSRFLAPQALFAAGDGPDGIALDSSDVMFLVTVSPLTDNCIGSTQHSNPKCNANNLAGCVSLSQTDSPPQVPNDSSEYACLTLANYARQHYNPGVWDLMWDEKLVPEGHRKCAMLRGSGCWDCHTNSGGGTTWGQNLHLSKTSCADWYYGWWVTNEAAQQDSVNVEEGHFTNVVGFTVDYVSMGCGTYRITGHEEGSLPAGVSAVVCNFGLYSNSGDVPNDNLSG